MALRILHVVPGLGVGGTESNLVRLVAALTTDFEHVVVNMGPEGPLQSAITNQGVVVVTLNLARRPLRGMAELRRTLKVFEPQVIHGWLYKGNFLASVAGVLQQPQRLLPGRVHDAAGDLGNRVTVLWSIRHSLQAWASETPKLRLLIRLLTWRPFAPWLVLYNAETSQQTHAGLGYERYPSLLLGNFLSPQEFTASAEERKQVRQMLDIGDDELLLGFIGREHRLKNVGGFLAAAQLLLAEFPALRIVLVGEGFDSTNEQLRQQLLDLGLQQKTRLLGAVEDTAALYNAMDLLISSSLSESTSNVLLEASACGCACVATDVGAAAELLPAEQRVAAATDTSPQQTAALAARLAAAAASLLHDEQARHAAASQAQQQVWLRHDASRVSKAYASVYRAAVSADRSLLPTG